MNILFVVYAISDRGKPKNGVSTYLYRISRSLVSMGHKAIILACGKKDENWIDNGVEVIRIKDDGLNYSDQIIDYFISSFRKSYRLNKAIKKLEARMKIDIIQFASLQGASLLYYGKIPAVMRLSAYARPDLLSYDVYPVKYAKVRSWVERCASRRCNAVFAPSNVIADAYGHDVKRKVYVIESPFVDEVEPYDESYADTILNNKKYALFFGNLSTMNGIKVIAKCLERFLEKNKDYYFVFVGEVTMVDGENAARFLKRCVVSHSDRLIILPALLHTQLYPIIMKADFVVSPSIMDNFPNACIEAMHFGKVVIGTDGSSFEQLIRHRVSGLLCRIGDPDDLLNKMQMAVDLDERQKEQIGINAKKRIEQLRPEVVGKKLLSFYQYVIDAVKKD